LGQSAAWGVAGIVLKVLVPVGLLAAIWYRPVRAWAFVFVGVVAIGLTALLVENRALSLVTRPWYGDPGRIAWPLSFTRPALAVGAVGGVLDLVKRVPSFARIEI